MLHPLLGWVFYCQLVEAFKEEMRKHGWQLPYHPLQVVAVAVFLALGFAFYVFFAPFVGKKMSQYVVMGVYTPLKPVDEDVLGMNATTGNITSETERKNAPSNHSSCFTGLLVFIPCAFLCNCSSSQEESSEQQMSEDGMFYCSLCEVEVFKYSKHCRVCDNVWIILIITAGYIHGLCTLGLSLQLVLQWLTGILVLICCFLERKRFSVDITSKLGSSFSLVPFVIVVCAHFGYDCNPTTCSAILLSHSPHKKGGIFYITTSIFFIFVLHFWSPGSFEGISTYDYIIALREQEQQGVGGQQSPQMSPASSLTGLSSASSFTTFHRGAWCTPPRLFLEDQFDVVPPDTGSVSSLGKKVVGDEPIKKKNPGAVKISPWTLARLNAEEVSKVAAEARKKSRILQPVARREAPFGLETDSSFGSSGRRMVPRPENNRRRTNKRTSTSLAPLQLEARSAFRTSRAMSSTGGIVASSPESSLDSPDLHPFRVSSSGAEEARRLTGLSAAGAAAQKGIPLSRSTSDGYEASGGEDSDRVPSRTVHRLTNWSNFLFNSDPVERVGTLNASASSSQANMMRKL
ncbi:putative protein S-acyltransferase 22 [Vitis vinifera]|uniref:Uncharacterized protein n=1 Tax=Vitis vinifera TaxID=29760 RepID=A0A438G3N3_VITVI|nr:putative protein S-acyltransferase 22 [Vitis vinifera]